MAFLLSYIKMQALSSDGSIKNGVFLGHATVTVLLLDAVKKKAGIYKSTGLYPWWTVLLHPGDKTEKSRAFRYTELKKNPT